MDKYEVVITATAQDLLIQFTDINTGAPIDLTACTAPHVFGHSVDLPSSDLDVTDGVSIPTATATQGIVKATEIGSEAKYVSISDLGQLDSATYTCEIRVTAAGGKFFFSPRFEITWKKPVVVPGP